MTETENLLLGVLFVWGVFMLHKSWQDLKEGLAEGESLCALMSGTCLILMVVLLTLILATWLTYW